MAGERRLNGDLRRLEVARLADKDAVRILAEKSAKAAGEVQADRFVDRHLHDAVDVILDRIFRGEQFGVRLVDFPQARVERGRFARAGRAGHDDDAVGQFDHLTQGLFNALGHAEFVQIELDRRTVQNTQHDALAVLRGQGGDAQVDVEGFPVADDASLDASVLRQAALGDVEVGDDLHARDQFAADRAVGLAVGAGEKGFERPVDAHADVHEFLERFEVDVARLGVDADVDEVVDNLHDILGAFLVGHRARGFRRELAQLFPHLGERGETLGGKVDGVVIFPDETLDLRDRGDADLEILFQGEAELGKLFRVEGIGQCDIERAVDLGHGQGAVQPRQADRDFVAQARLQFEIGEIDVVRADGIGDRSVEGVLIDVAVVDQEVLWRAPALLDGCEQFFRLRRADHALIGQRGDDEMRVHVSRCPPWSRRALHRKWSGRRRLSGIRPRAKCACPVRGPACATAPC